MRAEVLAWMQAQRMTEPGDTVVCAVSGGADSVSMLHVLLSLQDTLGIRVEAAHFNHHLRGAESDRDETFVRQLCASLGVPLHTGGGDVQARAAQTHESLEEAARKLRYAFFDTLPGLVATAHTQDDNLETVLLNLTRGTGLARADRHSAEARTAHPADAGLHAGADRGVSCRARLFLCD